MLLHRSMATDMTSLTISWPETAWIVGFDTWERVVSSLLAALHPAEEATTNGTIDGTEVGHVFTLEEHHGSLYVANVGSDLKWFWQDGDAQLVNQMTIDVVTRDMWTASLGTAVTS